MRKAVLSLPDQGSVFNAEEVPAGIDHADTEISVTLVFNPNDGVAPHYGGDGAEDNTTQKLLQDDTSPTA